MAVAGDGDLVAVAELGLGVRLYDVRDPDRLREIGFIATRGGARGVSVVARRVYIADGWAGVSIVDVDSAGPWFELGRVELPGRTLQVVVDGGIALAVTREGVAWVLDVSLPGEPAALGFLPVTGRALRVALAGTRAVASAGRLEIFDLADPASPLLVSSTYVGYRRSVVALVADGLLLGDDNGTGLDLYDTTDISQPTLVGRFSSLARFERAVAASESVVVGVQSGGNLSILDLTDAEGAHEAGVVVPQAGDRFIHVAAQGHRVLAVTDSARLAVVDVADPERPQVDSWLEIDGSVTSLDVLGGRVVIGGGYRRLTLADATRPLSPHVVARLDLDDTPFEVAAGTDRAALGYFTDRIALVDVPQRDAPAVVWSGSFHRWDLRGLALEGQLLAVAAGGGGLHLFDTSDLAAPVELLALDDVAFWTHDTDLEGGLLAVAWGDEGWSLVDVTEPTMAHDVARIDDFTTFAVRIDRDRLVAVGPQGLAVYDLAQCTATPPAAAFDVVRDRPGDDLSFALVNRSRGLPEHLEWRLPDGTISSQSTVLVSVPRPGVYRVSLTASNRHGSDTSVRQIAIADAAIRPGAGRISAPGP